MAQVRLQKILADAGLGSRRKCEKFICEGRVSVAGEVVVAVGSKADPSTDDIRFDGQPLQAEQKVYFLVNKPRGYICSSASAGKRRVIDLLADHIPQRVYPVGRLDVDSEGLIILTNDGDLANHLAHPRYGVEKTYQAKVDGRPDRKDLEKLRRGMHLAEGRVAGMEARIRRKDGRCTWVEVTLHEGKNREIRRILARLGYRVRRLRRTRIAGIEDPRLKAGAFRRLTRTEVARLRKAGASRKTPTKIPGGRRERSHSQ